MLIKFPAHEPCYKQVVDKFKADFPDAQFEISFFGSSKAICICEKAAPKPESKPGYAENLFNQNVIL